MDVQGWQLNNSFPRYASNHNATLSGLESLPAEILEPIFLGSCNGNLLLAAPRVAAKLHSQVVYRAAFLIAFYSYQLEETATVLGIHNLISFIQQPPQAWDIRSMTKVVLGSRWCTCGWTRDFLFSLFASVVQDSRIMLGSSDVFADDRLARRKSLQVYAEYIDRRRNASAGTSSLSPLSVDHFNVVLELLDLPEVDINDVRDAADDTDMADTDVNNTDMNDTDMNDTDMNDTDMNDTDMNDTDMTDDTDPSNITDAGDTTGVSDPDHMAPAYYWRYDNRYYALDDSAFRQLQWRFCGCITMRDTDLKRYRVDIPFCEVVFDRLRKIVFNGPGREDFSTLEDRILESVSYLNSADSFGCPMWEILAIDYYFRSEDDNFMISPSLHRRAALMDLRLPPINDNEWRRVHFLFEIDPRNLPRTDDYVRYWAAVAKIRRQRQPINQINTRQLEDMREGRVSLMPFDDELQDDLRAEYRWIMDECVLQHLNGGGIEPQAKGIWPNFDCSQLDQCMPALIGNDNVANKARRCQSFLQPCNSLLQEEYVEPIPWDEHIRDDFQVGQPLDGHISSADRNPSAFTIAMGIFERRYDTDPLHCIDWAVTRGRWDVESREILEDDNAYPDLFFQAPEWFIWP